MSTTNPTTAPPGSPKKTKHFIPLGIPNHPKPSTTTPKTNLPPPNPENNPTTMTTLLHTLGLSPSLTLTDVYSLSDPDLLAFVPRPAHALLLVFPISASYETFRTAEDSPKKPYNSCTPASGPAEEVLWYKQTIGNACGLIALLHAVSNGKARGFVTAGSDLDVFVRAAEPLMPEERAELIEESEALERAHRVAAEGGDTAAPGEGEEVDLHYVCFVRSERENGEGKLWEMDGRRKGPIERGELGVGEDVLSERALDLGVRAFLKREEEAGGGDLRFGVVALVEGGE